MGAVNMPVMENIQDTPYMTQLKYLVRGDSKKDLKLPKGSETFNGKTVIYKTLHRKQKEDQATLNQLTSGGEIR